MKVKDLIQFLLTVDGDKKVKIWYPRQEMFKENPIILDVLTDENGDVKLEIDDFKFRSKLEYITDIKNRLKEQGYVVIKKEN